MFLKGLSLGIPFGKKEVEMKGDAINTEKPDEDVDRAVDTLLTPMGDGGSRSTIKPVDGPLPLVAGKEDEEVAGAADALLTPMGGGEDRGSARGADGPSAPESSTDGEDTPDVKDVFAESAQTKNPSPGEEPSGKAPESGVEPVVIEPESEGKKGFPDSLFEEQEDEDETPIQNLIASLPDVTVEEVLSAAKEVKALMDEWQ